MGLTGPAAVAQVGASVFAGVMMMIVLIPINTKISKIQSGLNRQIMKLKDEVRPLPNPKQRGPPRETRSPRRQAPPSTKTPPALSTRNPRAFLSCSANYSWLCLAPLLHACTPLPHCPLVRTGQ